LEATWCGVSEDGFKEYEEIEQVVATKLKAYQLFKIRAFQSIRELSMLLLPWVEIKQREVDCAWLDAAYDVLGRPACKFPSNSHHVGDPEGFRIIYANARLADTFASIEEDNPDFDHPSHFDHVGVSRIHLFRPVNTTTIEEDLYHFDSRHIRTNHGVPVDMFAGSEANDLADTHNLDDLDTRTSYAWPMDTFNSIEENNRDGLYQVGNLDIQTNYLTLVDTFANIEENDRSDLTFWAQEVSHSSNEAWTAAFRA